MFFENPNYKLLLEIRCNDGLCLWFIGYVQSITNLKVELPKWDWVKGGGGGVDNIH